MISKELKELIIGLKKQGDMCFVDGVSESSISAFEKRIGCKLSEKYREWLAFSDGGEFFLPAGVQLFGIEHKPLINQHSKKTIVIGELSNGDPILCEKNGNRIAIYNQAAGRVESDEIYPDFFTFLRELKDILGIGE